MSRAIKMGMVGIGRAGWGMHIDEIKDKTDKFQIVAACDIIPERVEKMKERFGCAGYNNIDDLIADPNVELVDIATRSCDHYEHAKKALLAGKSVILEKPVTMNYDQIVELYKLSNQPGKPRLFARQNRRFEKIYQIIRETIDSGKLGNIFEIALEQRGYQMRDDWQTIREFGGGQVLNWGPHIIDHSLMLLNSDIRRQWGNLKQVAAGGDCEDHFLICFEGENNCFVRVCISYGSALNNGRQYVAYGSRGTIMCVNDHVQLKYINPEQELEPVISNPETPAGSFGATGTFRAAVEPDWIEEEYKLEGEDLTIIWDYIYDSYRNGTEYPIKDGEVLNLMKVITRLFQENEVVDCT